MRLAVLVTPRAARSEVVGWRGDELLVRVTAPPDAGKANSSVCGAVAAALGVPKSAVRVVRGHTGRHKLLDVHADVSVVESALGKPESGVS